MVPDVHENLLSMATMREKCLANLWSNRKLWNLSQDQKSIQEYSNQLKPIWREIDHYQSVKNPDSEGKYSAEDGLYCWLFLIFFFRKVLLPGQKSCRRERLTSEFNGYLVFRNENKSPEFSFFPNLSCASLFLLLCERRTRAILRSNMYKFLVGLNLEFGS